MIKTLTSFRFIIIATSCIILLNCASINEPIPSTFTNIKEISPSIVIEMRYYSSDNFIGKRIDGYHNPKSFITKEAAYALNKVQLELNKKGLSLKIFDSYRPQRAVNHFIRWAKVLEDTIMKRQYYPNVKKKDLFDLGYIAERSGHSRGSTVDLTIIELINGAELDMGSSFDFFGRKSHHSYKDITNKQKENRALLKSTMEKYGFKPYSEEWWHYTLANEPFPDTYFDFPIK
ncbi:MAG: M15 family metallopeptidase [Saprospiraceae bacterium]|nr:M15 family metallopeptidase [Saprospiraceae bacterium]